MIDSPMADIDEVGHVSNHLLPLRTRPNNKKRSADSLDDPTVKATDSPVFRQCTCLQHNLATYKKDAKHMFSDMTSESIAYYGPRDQRSIEDKPRFHCDRFEKCPPFKVVEIGTTWFAGYNPITHRPLDKWQRTALQEWKCFNEQVIIGNGFCYIEYMFAMFNQLLFRGSIRNHTLTIQKGIITGGCHNGACGVTDWAELTDLGPPGTRKIKAMKAKRTIKAGKMAKTNKAGTGIPKDPDQVHITLFGEIVLDPWAIQSEPRFGKDKLNSIAGALLHEMCHAFLGLYICTGEWKGCEPHSCHTLRKDNESHNGHGRHWQMLAKAVEQVSKDLLGIEVTLRHSQDLLEDIWDEEKGWLPSQCDMDNFLLRRLND